MLNVKRTRACVAMSCLACLAMAAANAARANDEQSSSKLQKPDHQQVTVPAKGIAIEPNNRRAKAS